MSIGRKLSQTTDRLGLRKFCSLDCHASQFPTTTASHVAAHGNVLAHYTVSIVLEITMGDQEISFSVTAGGQRYQVTEVMYAEPTGENAIRI